MTPHELVTLVKAEVLDMERGDAYRVAKDLRAFFDELFPQVDQCALWLQAKIIETETELETRKRLLDGTNRWLHPIEWTGRKDEKLATESALEATRTLRDAWIQGVEKPNSEVFSHKSA